jgi:hypothetical protein
MVRHRKPPSQTWRTFLDNHVKNLVSVDFFTVPTIRFKVLYVFLVLAHDRRRVVHFNVTAHPTAEWTAQQPREAFPFDQVPRYLLRGRADVDTRSGAGKEKAQLVSLVYNTQFINADRGGPLQVAQCAERTSLRVLLKKNTDN